MPLNNSPLQPQEICLKHVRTKGNAIVFFFESANLQQQVVVVDPKVSPASDGQREADGPLLTVRLNSFRPRPFSLTLVPIIESEHWVYLKNSKSSSNGNNPFKKFLPLF